MLQEPPPQHDDASDSMTVRRFFSSAIGWSVGAGRFEVAMPTILTRRPRTRAGASR